jgi:hypothetical protein
MADSPAARQDADALRRPAEAGGPPRDLRRFTLSRPVVLGSYRLSLRSTVQPRYTRFPIIFSRCFSKVTIGFIPRWCSPSAGSRTRPRGRCDSRQTRRHHFQPASSVAFKRACIESAPWHGTYFSRDCDAVLSPASSCRHSCTAPAAHRRPWSRLHESRRRFCASGSPNCH